MNFQVEFGMLTSVANGLHIKQTRKGKPGVRGLKIPFIIHPLQVLQRVQRWGIVEINEDNKVLWCAIVFHDSMEDTIASFAYVESFIGRKAALIALELTKAPDEDKMDYMSSFTEKSVDALAAKIADRLCNTEDFIQDDPGYALEYLQQADSVFETFKQRKEDFVKRFGESVCEAITQDIKNVYMKASNEKN